MVDRDRLKSDIITIKVNTLIVILVCLFELTVSSVEQEENSSYNSIWDMEMLLSWFLVGVISSAVFRLFREIRKDLFFYLFIVVFVISNVIYYGIDLFVLSGYFTTLYYLDIFFELVYVNIVFLFSFFIHAKYVTHNPVKFHLLVDCVQILNGIVFYLLILCCSCLNTEENMYLRIFIVAGYTVTIIAILANYIYYLIINNCFIRIHKYFRGKDSTITIDNQEMFIPNLHLHEIFIFKAIIFGYYLILWPLYFVVIYNIQNTTNFGFAIGYCGLSFIFFVFLFLVSVYKNKIIKDKRETCFLFFNESYNQQHKTESEDLLL